MKSADKVKKGLECDDCNSCPYSERNTPDRTNHCWEAEEDALALIQQLQAENAEKDARIKQLEKRVIHLEALNQSNLTTITMQERTRARLQERISQLEAERDALIDAVKDWGGACATCEHYSNEPDEIPCRFCVEMHPEDEDRISHWAWRGVQQEEQ